MPRLLATLALSAAVLALPAEAALASHYDHYLAPTSRCGGSKQTDRSLPTAEQELVMHCMHNYARKRAGRAAYSFSSLLASSSDAKSADMLRCQDFSHNACGRSLTYHFHRVGYTSGGCWGVGENIAWGSGPYGAVRSIMRGWLHSDGHRGAILSSRYREIGYGLRKGTFRGYRGAQVWTAHFGYRC